MSLASYLPIAVAIAAVAIGCFFFLNQSTASPPAPSKTSTKEIGEASAAPTDPNVCISPTTFTEFPISKKTQTSHNTAIYRFKLPTEQSILGLPIGQHISLAADLDVLDPKDNVVKPKPVVRSYTPISSDVHPGYFDLLIKSYPTGLLSKHFASLKEGDTMKVRGPKGQMVYTPNMVRRFGMIAGGTGITPMLQIAQAIRRGRKTGDKTQVDLIFANVNEEDILLREDLDDLNKEDGFNVYYVLNNPPEGWKGGVGFVTADMIKERLPAPAKDIKILICGPPPMVGAIKKATEALGYDKARPGASKLEDQIFAF